MQEAAGRWPALRERFADVELHMIGALQSNKAREAVELFDVIQTVDRPKLAQAIAREAQRPGRQPRLLLQVNTGAEPQKAGVAPEALAALRAAVCRDELALTVDGLMAIPPDDEDVAFHTAPAGQAGRRHGLAWSAAA